MRVLTCLLFTIAFFSACVKCKPPQALCDIEQAFTSNAAKVTISTGIWGTISSIEGNCMPSVPSPNPGCSHCPVKRTVLIYEYTLTAQATPSGNSPIFFDAFNTQLISQVTTDDNGFFQAALTAGRYSVAVLENGKLYANETDGYGGLNPVQFTGGTQKINVAMNYKATF